MAVILYCIAILHALMEASQDARTIAAHRPINHRVLWTFRAIGMTASAYLLGNVLWAIGGAFVFSAVFRWQLNSLRGLPATYISPSNVYDSVFLWAFGRYGGAAAYCVEVALALGLLWLPHKVHALGIVSVA
jgi:hypothetical protein